MGSPTGEVVCADQVNVAPRAGDPTGMLAGVGRSLKRDGRRWIRRPPLNSLMSRSSWPKEGRPS